MVKMSAVFKEHKYFKVDFRDLYKEENSLSTVRVSQQYCRIQFLSGNERKGFEKENKGFH